MCEKKILVTGFGSLLKGDDAFGIELAKRLEKYANECINVIDVGNSGISLVHELISDHFDVLIILDAIKRNGKPGNLYVLKIPYDSIPIEDINDS
ncbi:hypothetical protein DJ521_05435, partial [Sulfolobus sp. E3]